MTTLKAHDTIGGVLEMARLLGVNRSVASRLVNSGHMPEPEQELEYKSGKQRVWHKRLIEPLKGLVEANRYQLIGYIAEQADREQHICKALFVDRWLKQDLSFVADSDLPAEKVLEIVVDRFDLVAEPIRELGIVVPSVDSSAGRWIAAQAVAEIIKKVRT